MDQEGRVKFTRWIKMETRRQIDSFEFDEYLKRGDKDWKEKRVKSCISDTCQTFEMQILPRNKNIEVECITTTSERRKKKNGISCIARAQVTSDVWYKWKTFADLSWRYRAL